MRAGSTIALTLAPDPGNAVTDFEVAEEMSQNFGTLATVVH